MMGAAGLDVQRTQTKKRRPFEGAAFAGVAGNDWIAGFLTAALSFSSRLRLP
jgi:hypothetical protein